MDRLGAMKHATQVMLIFLLLSTVILIGGCATAPVEEDIPEQEAVAPEPVPGEAAPPEPEVTEPAVPEEVIVNDETGYEVSVEVYEKTLDEMRDLIDTLNKVISSRNYEKWKLYLSEPYIKTYNDKDKLAQISRDSKILSENDIELRNLKDYFEWVVVPSRSTARVDDVVFLDDTHLTVYMLIQEKNTILYQLENIDGNWLISVW